MIKLICPRCMKPVPVADDFAGKEVTCPNCMKPFDAPARYTPTVLAGEGAPARPDPPSNPPPAPESTMSPEPPRPPEPPAAPQQPTPPAVPAAPAGPPPGYAPAPPAYAPPVPAPSAGYPAQVPTPQLQGYTHARGITISPRFVAWMPAVLITVTFVCTFFRWIGSYLGGYPVYSQSPWRALFGRVGRNFELEGNMPGAGAWIDQVSADWELMLPYLLLLILAGGLAWADRAFSIDPRHASLVRVGLGGVWAWRRTLIAAMATLALALVVIQISRGFGMERAIRAAVRENPDLVKARQDAGGSRALLAAVENREDAELAKYNLERTWWQDLALACNVLAVVTLCMAILLEKRGNKPPPKLLLHY